MRQLFVKGGEHATDYSWDLSLLHGESRLIGNGPLPESMLAERRSQIYTRPDPTDNRVTMLTLNATREFGNGLELATTVYTRRVHAATVNGDLNDAYDPPTVPESAIEHRTRTSERGEGLAVQLSQTIGAHRLSVGATYDRARNDFEQSEAEGVLDGTRAVVVTQDPQVTALIKGTSRTASVFMSDIVTLAPGLNLTLSGRYNDTRVRTTDLGRSTLGLDTALDGEGQFTKFNPAAGLTWQITPALTAYGGFSQGNRAPSPIELGCSDPDHACVLPNALQGDPPLKQVVSRTLEAGVRGSLGTDLRWNASVFRTDNRDDLLFVGNAAARPATSRTSAARCARAWSSVSRSARLRSTGACRTATCGRRSSHRPAWCRRRIAAPAAARPAPPTKSRCAPATACRACPRTAPSSRSMCGRCRAGASAHSSPRTRANSCAATRTTRSRPTGSISSGPARSVALRS